MPRRGRAAKCLSSRTPWWRGSLAIGRLGDGDAADRATSSFQDGDVIYVAVGARSLVDFDAKLAPARPEGALMRVVIAGGGSVGRFIAEQLHEAGHDVLIIDNDPAVVRRGSQQRRAGGRPVARGRRVRGHELAEAGLEQGRRGRGRHRRRRGQPRDLAAGQAGVRRAACRRPRQQPEERVDVQRDVGRRRRRCRRRTCSPRSCRRRCPSARSSACSSFEGGRARLAEVTLGDRLAGRRPGDRRTRASRATRAWSASSATSA